VPLEYRVGYIDETKKTISVDVPTGTDVTGLTPSLKVSPKASYAPVGPQDFTDPVIYTVTAEDGSTQDYTVTVTAGPARSSAKAITAFSFANPDATGTIDEAEKTISVDVPYGTDVTSLTPSLTISPKASYTPDGPQDFTNPVTYTVTAENGSTQDYVVTVTIGPVVTGPCYIITGSGTTFTATKSGATIGTADQPIQDVVNVIRTHANGEPVPIQFGDNITALDIGTDAILFTDITGNTWGAITLIGKITSNGITPTIRADGNISVTIAADISNTYTNATSGMLGVALVSRSTGTLNIIGGKIQSTTGYAVYSSSTGKIAVSGTALVTSATKFSDSGTILIADNGTATATRLEITGGTVQNTAGGMVVRNLSTGAVDISGGTISATSGYWAVYNESTGTVNISGGALSAAEGRTVINSSTGAVNISGGTVSAAEEFAVGNFSTGKITVSGTARITARNSSTIWLYSSGTAIATRLEITGGTVENTGTAGNAVYNDSTGEVNISGGTVIATATSGYAYAVNNNSTGKITVSGTAQVNGAICFANIGTSTDARFEMTGGTVYGYVSNGSTGAMNISGGTVLTLYNEYSGTVNISGGTVSGVYNEYTGKVNISGGTVQNTAGDPAIVIIPNSTGKITISGTALVSSATENSGTIFLDMGGSNTSERLVITGGRVENTAAGGRAVRNISTGAITVSGGTVIATGTSGIALSNTWSTTTTISGGTISATGTDGKAIYTMRGTLNIGAAATVSATGEGGYSIYNDLSAAVTVDPSATIIGATHL